MNTSHMIKITAQQKHHIEAIQATGLLDKFQFYYDTIDNGVYDLVGATIITRSDGEFYLQSRGKLHPVQAGEGDTVIAALPVEGMP